MDVSIRFTRRAHRVARDLMGEVLFRKLLDYLTANPFAGDLVPGSGGARKLRWPVPGRGKRGGARILHCRRRDEIWVFGVYAKNKWENPPDWILKQWLKEIGS